ncbi:MAG TPA: hypothetical protein PK024_13600 [Methanospirillum sp.]|uniref:hypothetical protein n=1 Tax=Methanospirillum sp. TaxID=45200 RepID=UPI002C67D4AF|nr:hypothetical protein [Methanospirillum sp.]HOJ97861.1 hypothetical protein [Methanospirillum sp.]
MSTDLIVAGISIGFALLNAGAVAGMYVHMMRSARNVVCTIRAGENGEVRIDDPFLNRGKSLFPSHSVIPEEKSTPKQPL